jgi:hypothetical protein
VLARGIEEKEQQQQQQQPKQQPEQQPEQQQPAPVLAWGTAPATSVWDSLPRSHTSVRLEVTVHGRMCDSRAQGYPFGRSPPGSVCGDTAQYAVRVAAVGAVVATLLEHTHVSGTVLDLPVASTAEASPLSWRRRARTAAGWRSTSRSTRCCARSTSAPRAPSHRCVGGGQSVWRCFEAPVHGMHTTHMQPQFMLGRCLPHCPPPPASHRRSSCARRGRPRTRS